MVRPFFSGSFQLQWIGGNREEHNNLKVILKRILEKYFGPTVGQREMQAFQGSKVLGPTKSVAPRSFFGFDRKDHQTEDGHGPGVA